MFVVSLAWLSCEDDREIEYNDAIVQQHADPYLQVVTGFIPFEVGTESYDFEFNVINGVVAVENIKLYGSFYDAESKLTSNELLYGEYPVDDPLRSVITDTFTYDELKEGLLVDGNPLPDSDEDIYPGSGWAFRFEGDYASGKTLPLAGQINMVLSKYAGNYEVIESDYWRIGVQSGLADWTGTVVFIGFVDEVTLSHNDFWGPFAWTGFSFHFSVDPDDNTIIAPLTDEDGVAIPDGQFSGLFSVTCGENASKFDNVPCEDSNIIVDDEGGPGKHRIYLTYGYQSADGGIREFYEVLERIVD